jgi:hypothetical protein
MRSTALLLCFSFLLVAQDRPPGPVDNPLLEEARETVRFIRLAETRKRLDFDEKKLLALNERLDAFEERKFSLLHQERLIHKRVLEKEYSPGEENQILQQFNDLREKIHRNEMGLYQELVEILSPAETLEFFVFYEQFQRDIGLRIRQLQQRRNQGGMPERPLLKGRKRMGD